MEKRIVLIEQFDKKEFGVTLKTIKGNMERFTFYKTYKTLTGAEKLAKTINKVDEIKIIMLEPKPIKKVKRRQVADLEKHYGKLLMPN